MTPTERARARRRVYRPRAWRAVAYVPDPTAPQGRRRELAGRTAATTPDGLARFKLAHEAQGHAVDVFKVAGLEELL